MRKGGGKRVSDISQFFVMIGWFIFSSNVSLVGHVLSDIHVHVYVVGRYRRKQTLGCSTMNFLI